MKILILSPRLPHTLGKADSMTVYRIIRYFAQRHEVYLACFYDHDAELAHVPDLKKLCQEVQCVKLRKWQSALNVAGALARGGAPLQVAYYRDCRMRRVVNGMLERCKPDLAYAHLIRMGEYLKDKRGMLRVLAMQISQTLNYRRMIANIRSTFYRMLYRVEYNRVCRYEPAITKSFDICLLISKHDKESLYGHERVDNVFYSPHGVDVEFYTPSRQVEKENAILFCGVLETPTNIDAVLFFYQDIFPLIKEQVPGVRLYLVGISPPAVIHKIAEDDPSVVVTGFVEDIRSYYCKAKVGIDPLRIGAGLQNKLLIGMSMGLPMVCTSIANEGIAGVPGKHLLIADVPQDFANAVIELFTNPAKAESIAREARKYVEGKWTWEYYFDILEKHFIDLAHKV
jgi:polysaccharide biosynthesis protein PslH